MSIYIPYYLRTEMSACMDWIAWLILGLATSRREPTARDCDRLDLYLQHRSGTALLSVPENTKLPQQQPFARSPAEL